MLSLLPIVMLYCIGHYDATFIAHYGAIFIAHHDDIFTAH